MMSAPTDGLRKLPCDHSATDSGEHAGRSSFSGQRNRKSRRKSRGQAHKRERL